MEQANLLLASTFSEFFRGSPAYFGQSTKKDDGTWKTWTAKGQVTISHFQKHLEGNTLLGIAPIYNQTKVNFCAIDMDALPGQEIKMFEKNQKKLAKLGMPLVFAKSKSGALHAYLFFEESEEASKARSLMQRISQLAHVESFEHKSGNPQDIEVFPKQNAETSTGGSSWINIPYFGGEDAKNVVVDNDGKELPMVEGFNEIRNKRTSVRAVEALLKGLPLSDGPPCLQHIVLTGNLKDGEGRNNFVYSLTRYYKARNESDIEGAVMAVNETLAEPLPFEELSQTVKSAVNHDSAYGCHLEPMKSLCRRHDCVLREFGIDSATVNNLSFGQLKKFLDDPCYYEWTINDKVLRFNSVDEIWSYRSFQKKVFTELDLVAKNITVGAWQKILSNAMANKIDVVLERGETMSMTDIMLARVAEYLSARGQKDDIMQVLNGIAYKDDKNKRYLFQPPHLFQFLQDKGFRAFTIQEFRQRLERLDAKAVQVKSGSSEVDMVYCWSLPYGKLADYVNPTLGDIDYEQMANNLVNGMGV